MKKTIDEIQRAIADWQNNTFNEGKKTPKTAIPKSIHLQSETEELTEKLEILFNEETRTEESYKEAGFEIADVFILTFGIMDDLGLLWSDMEKIIQDKMEINKSRTWGEADGNGVVNHLKTANNG